jgi:25S rRNA (adenine2142-N1)-methyltransferase
MGRKRKLLTGVVPIGGPSLKSRKKAREVTSRYHSIRNELELINNNKSGKGIDNRDTRDTETDGKDTLDMITSTKVAALEKELEDIGGTNRYQEASIVSTQHFKTSRWVLSTIESLMGRKPTNNTDDTNRGATTKTESAERWTEHKPNIADKYHALEIGAINIQLQQCPWLDTDSIDVNSQHPLIKEINFFDLPLTFEYDICISSMVVNCVTKPSQRGEMLLKMRYILKNDNSLLLLVLPSRCVDSKYVTLNQCSKRIQSKKKYNNNKDKHKGRHDFALLLQGLGYIDVTIAKETPHLVFYSMRRGPLASTISNDDNTVTKNALSSSSSPSAAANIRYKCNESFSWENDAKLQLKTLSSNLSKHYNKENTDMDTVVPPKDFAIGFSSKLWTMQ